jgi:hypothetical protein
VRPFVGAGARHITRLPAACDREVGVDQAIEVNVDQAIEVKERLADQVGAATVL